MSLYDLPHLNSLKLNTASKSFHPFTAKDLRSNNSIFTAPQNSANDNLINAQASATRMAANVSIFTAVGGLVMAGAQAVTAITPLFKSKEAPKTKPGGKEDAGAGATDPGKTAPAGTIGADNSSNSDNKKDSGNTKSSSDSLNVDELQKTLTADKTKSDGRGRDIDAASKASSDAGDRAKTANDNAVVKSKDISTDTESLKGLQNNLESISAAKTTYEQDPNTDKKSPDYSSKIQDYDNKIKDVRDNQIPEAEKKLKEDQAALKTYTDSATQYTKEKETQDDNVKKLTEEKNQVDDEIIQIKAKLEALGNIDNNIKISPETPPSAPTAATPTAASVVQAKTSAQTLTQKPLAKTEDNKTNNNKDDIDWESASEGQSDTQDPEATPAPSSTETIQTPEVTSEAKSQQQSPLKNSKEIDNKIKILSDKINQDQQDYDALKQSVDGEKSSAFLQSTRDRVLYYDRNQDLDLVNKKYNPGIKNAQDIEYQATQKSYQIDQEKSELKELQAKKSSNPFGNFGK